MFFNKYPYTDFHELNLDWVLETVKQLIADWGTYQTDLNGQWDEVKQAWLDTEEAWLDLKHYVENYFDTLDLQEEVNTKLDEMASNGTLDALLLPYFNAYKAEINNIISGQNDRITVLETRMDSFTHLAEGSTTGDAELIDARIAYNGETYSTAGDAIRAQASDLNAEILQPIDGYRTAFLELDTDINMINIETSIADYAVFGRNESGSKGILKPAAGFSATDFIPVDENDIYYFDTYLFVKYYAFYDKDRIYISGANNGSSDTALSSPLTVPAGAKYARFSYVTSNSNRVWLATTSGTHRKSSDPRFTDTPIYTPKNIDFGLPTYNDVEKALEKEAAVDRSAILPDDLLELMDRSGWRVEQGSRSYVNVYNDMLKKELPCLRLTKDNSHTYAEAYCNIVSTDITDKGVQIMVHLPDDDIAGLDDFNGCTISLYSGGASTSDTTRRALAYIQYEAASTPGYNADYVRCGWFILSLYLPSYAYQIGNNFDATNITSVGIRIHTATASTVRSADIYSIKFIEQMLRPGIITIVDNFDGNVPAMADYAASKGVRLNLSIIPGSFEGDPDAPASASYEELERIAAQGHFIFNHTWAHKNFNDLTAAEIADEINKAELWMQQHNFKDGAPVISIPSARFNTASYEATMRTNAKCIFHDWSMFNNSLQKVWYPFSPAGLCLDTCMLDTSMGSNTSLAVNIATNAVLHGGIAVIGFHGTYWSQYNDGEKWRAYIDAIAAISGAHHYGIDEIINGQFI